MEWITPKISIERLVVRLVAFDKKPKKSKINGRIYYRKVALKNPYLIVDAAIIIDQQLILGATYLDNTNKVWSCTGVILEYSILINITPVYNDTFYIPKKFILASNHIAEIKMPIGMWYK